jgi:hypothetical protein
MKIRQAAAELFHVKGESDMKNLIAVTFRSFTKAPKMFAGHITNNDYTFTVVSLVISCRQ